MDGAAARRPASRSLPTGPTDSGMSLEPPVPIPATSPTSAGPPSPRRISRARILVWIVLLLLAALAANEWRARRAHESALSDLLAALREAEGAGRVLSPTDVDRTLSGRPVVRSDAVHGLANSASRVDVYRWISLRHRDIYVYYGVAPDPHVLSIETAPTPTADELYPPPTEEEIAEARRLHNEEIAKKIAELKSATAPKPAPPKRP